MLRGSLPEVFLDTDVAFDIISKRTPHFGNAVYLLELVAKDKITLLIGECSLANLIYLSYDIYKLPDAIARITEFIAACEVINAGKAKVLLALASSFSDKEVALQYFAALHHGADYFLTRNVKDYKNALKNLPVFTPRQFLNSLV